MNNFIEKYRWFFIILSVIGVISIVAGSILPLFYSY